MSATAYLPPGLCRGLEASMRMYLTTDLERFWPSRRGHAFDEFCR